MKRFVSASLEEIFEGVGDKYAQRKWGIPDEEAIWKRKFHKATTKDKIVYDSGSVQIIMNPSSFAAIEPYARGVILKNGDLYIAENNNIIHYKILNILQELNIIDKTQEASTYHKTPPFEYLTIQRYKETNIIALGESLIYLADPDDNWFRSIEGYTREKLMKMAKEYLYAAKKKNPSYKYSYDLVDKRGGLVDFI